MRYLELTFADPARNLACDQALLEWCEEQDVDGVLRVWEPQNYFVVLGHSNKLATEVNVTACAGRGMPILRRFSGGGAVLQGPGCLNYALVIKNRPSGIAGAIGESYRRVLKRHQKIFVRLMSEAVQIQGISDLAIGGRKFSGNAQYRKHRHVLVHGSFLLDLDLPLVESCLCMPSREPSYRQGRSHLSFLRNLCIDSSMVREALKEEWGVESNLDEVPRQRIEELANQRYSCSNWSCKF